MSEPRLTYLDYVRAAFKRRWPVPGLGHLPLNQLALAGFFVLGIANPGFWLLGLATEVAYLGWLSGNARFQKLVRGERLERVQESWEDRLHRAVERLDPDSRGRYRTLLDECRRILGLSGDRDEDSLGSFRDLRAQNLNQLLSIFLRLLTSREVLRKNLETLDDRQLEREIHDLEQRLQSLDPKAEPALARSLQGTLDIQKKRLENFRRAGSSRQVIDAELQRIERQVELLREEAAVSGGPEALSSRLDAVTSTMDETTRWMDQNAELFQGLSGEPAEGLLAALPRLPETAESGEPELPPVPTGGREKESA